LYKSGLTLDDARQRIAEQARVQSEVRLLADFLQSSRRGIIR
jgi:UDP-N-acetylglucosamine acyltransferase